VRYNYKCKHCKKAVEVDKPMVLSSREEKCPTCKKVMDRDYSGAGIITADGSKF